MEMQDSICNQCEVCALFTSRILLKMDGLKDKFLIRNAIEKRAKGNVSFPS
jgi:hypothetical protein